MHGLNLSAGRASAIHDVSLGIWDGSVIEDTGSRQNSLRVVGEKEVDLLLFRHEAPCGTEQVLEIPDFVITFGILTVNESRVGIGIHVPGIGESEGTLCVIFGGHDPLKESFGRQTVSLVEHVDDLPLDGEGEGYASAEDRGISTAAW
jgi:hypothetical protein